jgi:hypothetical protein
MWYTLGMPIDKSRPIESWRELNPDILKEYKGWVSRQILDRYLTGVSEYDSEERGFQGNPLEELVMELFDSIFYIFMELRKQGLITIRED